MGVKCKDCSREIKPTDKGTHKLTNEITGKLEGLLHRKCWYIRLKKRRLGPDGRHDINAPSSYEVASAHRNADDATIEAIERRARGEQALAELRAKRATVQTSSAAVEAGKLLDEIDAEIVEQQNALALAARQVEIAEQRAQEDNRSEVKDWRGPDTAEV